MAKNGTECDAYRESTVYVSAEIEGYLEKKTGYLGAKTKQWCSLRGSTLYLQKKQSDVVKTIDLAEATEIRKVTNESTGTHFEICIKKKNHVFICPSDVNCIAWIQALQFAIARKKPSSQHSSSFSMNEASFTDDKYVYNEIDEALIRESRVCNVNVSDTQTPTAVKLSDYTEPYDRQSGVRQCNGDYWEVGDLRNTLRQSATGSAYNDNQFFTHYATIDQVNFDRSEPAALPLCKDVYAQVNKPKNPTLLHRPSVSGNDMPQTDDTVDENLMSGSTRNSAVEKETSNKDNNFAKSENLQMSGPDTEEDGKLCQILADNLTDSGFPTYDNFHPLTDEDWKPIKELTEFLSNNHEICRASYSCMSTNSDPVSTLKSYLATLDISVRQMDND